MKKALFLLLLSSVSMLGFAQLNNPNADVD